MATNVSPEYRKAEQSFKKARSTEEKVSALREKLAQRLPARYGEVLRFLGKLRFIPLVLA